VRSDRKRNGSPESLIGIVALSLWAAAVASDYSTGWVRFMVAAESRRWRLLFGRLVALSGFTVVAAGGTAVMAYGTAVPLATGFVLVALVIALAVFPPPRHHLGGRTESGRPSYVAGPGFESVMSS